MKRIHIALVLGALSLTACSSASGPTFSAYELQPRDGVRTYRVDCHGIFSSQATCMKVATRMCNGEPVHPVDSTMPFRDGTEIGTLVFQCRGGNTQTSTGDAAAPPPVAIVAPMSKRVTLSGDANFDFNRATLTPAATQQLDKVIAEGSGMTFGTIGVSGYTDRVGTDAYNLRLSEQRAQAVASYLQIHGLNARQFEIHGYGTARPIAGNNTAAGRAQNRRVEIVLPEM
ncbi:OmpA family protein [Burkholderia cenocepacia]|nr:OmpA family protein [Burkholderia cenocepacia]